MLRRWKHPNFSSRSRARLESLENNLFDEGTKRRIIFDTIYHDNSENYSSFIVCRNPVEKLLSVYKYLLDMFRRKAKSSKNFENSRYYDWDIYDGDKNIIEQSSRMANKWPSFYDAIANNYTLPTWTDFLEIVVDSSSVSF